MTVAISVVEDNLRAAILEAGTNTNVIFIASNGPRPALPYTCIEYVTTQAHAFDYTHFDLTDEVDRLYGHRVQLFTITTFGDNAIDEANHLNSAVLGLQSFAMALNMSNQVSMAVSDVTSVNYDYIIRDDAYEKTAFFDIILNVVLEDGSTSQDPGYFDEVADPVWTNEP